MMTSRTTGALLLTAALVLLGATASDAAPRVRKSRTVRMTPADTASGTRAQGRMTFRTRRGTTYMSGAFTRLTPETMHTVRFDDTGADGPQFVTDRRGRAKIRAMAVSADAATDTHHFSVVDESGDPVLTHDDAHAGSGMHDDGHMDGADHATHHDDPAMHDDGHMDGTDHGAHHGDGGTTGAGATGTDHGAHHGGTSSSGSGSMHGGGGMMKR